MRQPSDAPAGSPGALRRFGVRGLAFQLLVLATVASFCGYVLLLPLVPLWAARGGASEFGAGSTTSVFMLTTVLTQLAMPWLLDHGGYRWTFAVGALLMGLPAPLLATSTHLGPLLAISGVRGIGFGMVTVAGAALAVRLVPPDQIGRASGYYGAAVGVPNLVFLSTGVWLATTVGFDAVFWIAGTGPVLGAVAAVGIWLVAGDGRAGRPAGLPGEPAPNGARLHAALAVPLVVMLVIAMASSGIVTFLAIPLERVAGGVVTAALLGYGAMSVIGRWGAGVLSDLRGRSVLLTPGAAGAVLGTAMIAWSLWPAGGADWDGPGAAGSALIVAGAALFGAGFGAVQNDTIVVMFRRSGPSAYGTASAAWNIGYDGGTGIGALVLGIAIQGAGYGGAFSAAGLAVALCLPLAVVAARSRHSPR